MTIKINESLANARLDQVTVARDAGVGPGSIRVYNGVRPATGGAATTLLAEPVFSDPSSPAASGGVLTANAITSANALVTGTATWFREVDGNGNFVLDGDVGLSGSDLNLNTVDLVSGVPVSISSYVLNGGNL
jgi:hypothetical protein